MPASLVIAKNTLDEARHNKVLYIALAFFLLLIVFSRFMGEVSIHQQVKVLKDIGLAAISLFAIFIAIFMSVTSLYRDLNLRTIYSIISKPVSRSEIVIGKLIGLCLAIFIVVLGMSAFLYVILFFSERAIDLQLVPALVLICVEAFVIAAVGLVFSSFTTPFLSGIFTMGVFLIGRVSSQLAEFGRRSENEIFKFVTTQLRAVYDLEAFNLRTEAAYHLPIYREDFVYPLFYAAFMLGILVFIAIVLFQKRDFK